ncbi:DUF5993 family protein [Agaribacterium haliotis]|uniref:DUF5993 family protein n=1 Tax=Agaribacterium haliotis TaxID=2013869 RepID=UPI0039C887BA
MMALLFGLFLAVLFLLIFNKWRPAAFTFVFACIASSLWFMHHASDPLNILL